MSNNNRYRYFAYGYIDSDSAGLPVGDFHLLKVVELGITSSLSGYPEMRAALSDIPFGYPTPRGMRYRTCDSYVAYRKYELRDIYSDIDCIDFVELPTEEKLKIIMDAPVAESIGKTLWNI